MLINGTSRDSPSKRSALKRRDTDGDIQMLRPLSLGKGRKVKQCNRDTR